MALNKQVHIYSVDTSAFFTNEESETNYSLKKAKYELKISKNILSETKKGKNTCNIEKLKEDIKNIRKTITETKENLDKLINSSPVNNVRILNGNHMNEKNLISIFDSTLTRSLDMKPEYIYEDIIIVQIYYFKIMQEIITNGFFYKGEKYIFLTASAGQIRTKKTVFIKESIWKKNEKTLMCGLTIGMINAKNGINVNKFLAYLALSNSATDQWVDFNIDKCIVVDDFETSVFGEVDLIDDEHYSVTRKFMDVLIPHTDGCGMILPQVSNKNFMVRLPWVKGLLATFPFTKFIREHREKYPELNLGEVEDIYGKKYNILKDDIQIIFTKSQFKMWKYYSSWDDYKTAFKEFKCQAGVCNIEEDYFTNAKLNYQMLQTLTDISDSELSTLTSKTRDDIKNLASDRNTMLKVFGATKENNNKSYLQEALYIYPELLNDVYTKEVLKKIKKSLVNDSRAGKFEVDGKYTFIIPDLYAFCQHLFLKIEKPEGLLDNGEVSCRLFPYTKKLDCLRSPHLYKEHAVRNNLISSEIKRWFKTPALYTSTHDLISKILQFDCDGDKSLVCADELFVRIAERNMKGVVPLYYNMKKAEDKTLDSKAMYVGMKAAYTGGNIGVISNDISKLWNHPYGDELHTFIKLLCMENNFTIDYAKTLYKPKRPEDLDHEIRQLTKDKLPHFFIYAKDKKINQVSHDLSGTVNKLREIIKNNRITFKSNQLGQLNYKQLMSDKKVNNESSDFDQIVETYKKLTREYYFRFSKKNNFENIQSKIKICKDELLSANDNPVFVTDVLVYNLYKKNISPNKEILWQCFGDIILNNLYANLGNKDGLCIKCNKRYEKTHQNQKLCIKCSTPIKLEYKTIKCIDCMNDVRVNPKNTKTTRCKKCQTSHSKIVKATINRNYYEKKMLANNQ